MVPCPEPAPNICGQVGESDGGRTVNAQIAHGDVVHGQGDHGGGG